MRRNFDPLHEWMRENDAAGSVMVPEDIEDHYHWLREDNPEWPEWNEVRDAMLDSWEWRKGIAEMMAERAFEMFDGMIADVLAERR